MREDSELLWFVLKQSEQPAHTDHIRRGERSQDDRGKRASAESAADLGLLRRNQGTQGPNLKTQILAVGTTRKTVTAPGCEDDDACVGHLCSCSNCLLMFLASV